MKKFLPIFLLASLCCKANKFFNAAGSTSGHVQVVTSHYPLTDTVYKDTIKRVTAQEPAANASLISNKSTGTSILYSEDFESTVIDNPVWIKEAIDTANAVTTSSDVARKNGRSAKFSFDFSDWTDVSSLQPAGHRTELHPRRGTIPSRFDLDKDYWIGFSNYFPATWQLDPTTTIVWQFHGFGNADSLAGGSNQPALYGSVNANKDFVNIQVIDSTGTMFSIGRVPIVKNQWNDWVMHIKFSYKSGYDTVWVNGKKVAAYAGSNFYHVANQVTDFGPYFKIGIYKPCWGTAGIIGQASNLTMYDDAIVIGNSNASYSKVTSFFGAKPANYSNTQTFATSAAFAIKDVFTSSNTNKPVVYPNPAKNNITVQFNANSAGDYIVELTGISGKTLLIKRVSAVNGVNKIKLDVSGYAQGMYIINVIDDKQQKQALKLNIVS
jgi:polysaccharide lyase-like protein/type IX secretion system substrate protein